jgi:hypothetical protein
MHVAFAFRRTITRGVRLRADHRSPAEAGRYNIAVCNPHTKCSVGGQRAPTEQHVDVVGEAIDDDEIRALAGRGNSCLPFLYTSDADDDPARARRLSASPTVPTARADMSNGRRSFFRFMRPQSG